jgi:ribosome-associated protein
MHSTPKLTEVVRHALADLKANDIIELDVHEYASFTDVMLFVSGTSTRHVKSIADEVLLQAKLAGFTPIGVEGYTYGEWVLVDLGDVVVHVMLPSVREFYQLEKLWSDLIQCHPR